jgi:hypothetical protein
VVGVLQPGFRGLRVSVASDLMVPVMMKAAMTPGGTTWKNAAPVGSP